MSRHDLFARILASLHDTVFDDSHLSVALLRCTSSKSSSETLVAI